MTPLLAVQLPLLPSSKPGFLSSCVVVPGGGGAAPSREYNSRFGEPTPSVILFGVALSRIAAQTVEGEAVLLVSRYSAASPVACCVAIKVPLMGLGAVSLEDRAERTVEPGARIWADE